jgi:hypothetical protein
MIVKRVRSLRAHKALLDKPTQDSYDKTMAPKKPMSTWLEDLGLPPEANAPELEALVRSIATSLKDIPAPIADAIYKEVCFRLYVLPERSEEFQRDYLKAQPLSDRAALPKDAFATVAVIEFLEQYKTPQSIEFIIEHLVPRFTISQVERGIYAAKMAGFLEMDCNMRLKCV